MFPLWPPQTILVAKFIILLKGFENGDLSHTNTFILPSNYIVNHNNIFLIYKFTIGVRYLKYFILSSANVNIKTGSW